MLSPSKFGSLNSADKTIQYAAADVLRTIKMQTEFQDEKLR